MRLLEGPDLGHSLIYWDGKLGKKVRKRKNLSAHQVLNPPLREHEAISLPLRHNSSPDMKYKTQYQSKLRLHRVYKLMFWLNLDLTCSRATRKGPLAVGDP